MWGSDIKIEEFEPTATEFNIRINKQGNSIKDASLCSQGETQTINTAISFSIIESGIDSGGYDVLRLDEVDGAFDEKRRIGFIDTIQNRIDEMGCDSCFIITHNGEFEDIPCDIIIFKQEKGMQIPEEKLKNKNVLFRYK
jgi:DNA repair exonuclease SbcCD ATPase subunit